MAITVGTKLNNRYFILKPLGEGGMGRVFLANDTFPEVPVKVAVKQLCLNPANEGTIRRADPEETRLRETPLAPALTLRGQFEQEARTLYRLQHPNLPRVMDYLGDSDEPYLVMEMIEGQNLEKTQQQAEDQPLPLDQVTGWIVQVLDAVEYCHAKGVIHQDIKPANIIIDASGKAFLVDFGIARNNWLVQPAHLHGATLGFSPPEQYEPGAEIDERSDIYALGATLYCLLTGKTPPSGRDRQQAGAALDRPTLHNPNLPPEMENVILKAMALNPRERYSSAHQMRAALNPQSHKPAPPVGAVAANTSTPALIIILLDASMSMELNSIGGQTRHAVAVNGLNRMITRMVTRAARGTAIAPRYRLAMLSYGNYVKDLLGGIKTITQVAQTGLPADWGYHESTDTAEGFAEVRRILEAEIPRLGRCPTPLVVHFTDGEYNEGCDPTPTAQAIAAMETPGGNVLIENIFLNEDPFFDRFDPETWPGVTSLNQLTSPFARNLYGISSVLPDMYRATLQDWGYHLHEQARMLIPGSRPELVELGFCMAAATPLTR